MQRIIAFGGLIGVGKDTAANYMVKQHGYLKYGFANPLKAGLQAMFGWSLQQMENQLWKQTPDPFFGFTPRYAMQKLGTEWGREMLREDLWLKCAERFCLMNPTYNVVICDIRFDNEASWVRARGGKVIVLLRGDGYSSAEARHASEAGISRELVDQYIYNDTTLTNLYNAIEAEIR